MQQNPYSGHGVSARKGQTLARTLGAGEYSLVVDNGAADGWYFLSLAGLEKGGGTAAGREGLARFGVCGELKIANKYEFIGVCSHLLSFKQDIVYFKIVRSQ
ncbi:hypothetical protein [Deinococcus marmoris]|uniref:hypothetical protein n=1 Tax=Deinococcus marmoris TaxID=249408 RepID=UPI000497008B|nr:hypothetical protein [Deinococcus marmoris]